MSESNEIIILIFEARFYCDNKFLQRRVIDPPTVGRDVWSLLYICHTLFNTSLEILLILQDITALHKAAPTPLSLSQNPHFWTGIVVREEKRHTWPNCFISLANFSPMSHFYTPWKRQKTYGFLTFSGDIEMWHWTKMG